MSNEVETKNTKTITVDEDFFEHLLNCMANQKYLPTLEATKFASNREAHHQNVVDAAYQKARELWINNGEGDDLQCGQCEAEACQQEQEKGIVIDDLSLGVKETLLWCIANIAIKDVAPIISGIDKTSVEGTMQELMEVRKALRGRYWHD